MQPHDRLFCEIAVQLELLTREQVADCMRTLQSDPRGRNIGSIAAALGLLTREQVDLVLAHQQRVLARRRDARNEQRNRRDASLSHAGGTNAARAMVAPAREGPVSGPKPADGRSHRSKDATPTSPWQQRAALEPGLLGSQPRFAPPTYPPESARETMNERPLPRGLSATLLQGAAGTATQRPAANHPPALGPHGTQLGPGAGLPPGPPLGAAGRTSRAPANSQTAAGLGPGFDRASAIPARVTYAPPSRTSGEHASPPQPGVARNSGTPAASSPAPRGALSGAPSRAAEVQLPLPAASVLAGGTLLGASALAQAHEARRPAKRGAAARDWRNPSRPPPSAPSLDDEPEPVSADAEPTPQPMAAALIRSPQPPAPTAPGFLDEALKLALDAGGSDLHLHSGSAVFVRIDGKLWPLATEAPFSRHAAEQVVSELLDEAQRTQLSLEGELRFVYDVQELGRFRVHAYCQERGVDIVLRLLPQQLSTPEKLGLTAPLRALREHDSGLCLFSGPSGAGKSTTLATLIKALASQRALYSVSLENPVEMLHTPALGVIEQRELGRDFASFAQGVEAAQRMGADVIAVADVADPTTLLACLRAARSGCLVLGALRASSCAQALVRLLRDVEDSQLERVRFELAQGLRVLFQQRLVPRVRSQGRVLALESVVNTPQLAQLIREDKLQQLAAVMAAGKTAGMITLDDALDELVRAGTIAPESARHAAHRRDRFKLP